MDNDTSGGARRKSSSICIDPLIEVADQNRDSLYKAAISPRRQSEIDQTLDGDESVSSLKESRSPVTNKSIDCI